MKYLLWAMVLLTGCAGSRSISSVPDGTYAGILPTKNGLVFYQATVAKQDVTPVTADSRTRAWLQTSGRALNAIEQKPIRYKTDLVYLATLPGRRFAADLDTGEAVIPALHFWVTVDNTGDSSRVFATNFEVMVSKGRFESIEQYPYAHQPVWLSMWLADIDAAVTEMIRSLTNQITQPAPR